ncbi:hypothetical protein CGCTS75_v011247 [Colletotrichum tropicale]|nr:hypothetical protein CGCTS75_v011247 [Colletotrichum tropicale]
MRPLAREDTIVPAVCFSTCNNCYLEVQAVGKDPSICEPGSDFQSCRATCVACIDANAPDANTSKETGESKFKQYLDYCEGAPVTTTASTTSTFESIPASRLTTITTSLIMAVTGIDGKITSRLMPTTIVGTRDETTSSSAVTTPAVTSNIAPASGVASLQPVDEDYCYKVAQIIGTIPSLCFSESLFKECFNECAECAVTAVEVPKPSLSEVFEVFKPYTDYCAGPGIMSSYPQSLLTTAVRTQIFALTGFGSTEPGYPEIVVATITEMRPGVFTPQATSQATSQPVESTASEAPASGNNAWIDGPVVGTACAIILLFFGWWFLKRRRRHKAFVPTSNIAGPDKENKERFEKAELHADDAPKIHPTELEGSHPDPVPEMSANEIAAQEMLSPELRSPVEMPERQAT